MKRLILAFAVILFSAAVYAQDNLALRGVEVKTSLVNYEGEIVKKPIIKPDAFYAAYFEGDKVVSPFIGPYTLEDINDDLNMRIAQVLNHKDVCNQNAKPSARPTGGTVKMLKFMRGNDVKWKIEGGALLNLTSESARIKGDIPYGAMLTPVQIEMLKQIQQENNKAKIDSLSNQLLRQLSPEQQKKIKETVEKKSGS